MDSFLHLEYGFTIRIFPIFVYRYIRQKYQKQGERLSSSRLLKKRTRKSRFPSRGTFSRTGRTCYGFQILIRSKEEEEEEEEEEEDEDDDEDDDDDDEDDDEDDEMSGTPYTLPTFRQRTTVREFPFT